MPIKIYDEPMSKQIGPTHITEKMKADIEQYRRNQGEWVTESEVVRRAVNAVMTGNVQMIKTEHTNCTDKLSGVWMPDNYYKYLQSLVTTQTEDMPLKPRSHFVREILAAFLEKEV